MAASCCQYYVWEHFVVVVGALLCYTCVALLAPPPNWSELEARLLVVQDPPCLATLPLKQKEAFDGPILVRERHGWCVYSTRVWLALEIKGISYHTYLVESQGDTYDGADDEDGIPSTRPEHLEGLTLPQIKLPGEESWRGADKEQDLLELLHLLDTTPTNKDDKMLFPSDAVWKAARAFQDCIPIARESRRAAWLFCAEEGYRLDALPRDKFVRVLDQAEDLLSTSKGPFFCGSTPTAADIVWTPLLERYAAQLPCLHRGLQPRSNHWPRLREWYQAMETIPAYASRIRGDAPSWRQVLYADPWWPRADLWHSRDTVGSKGELQATEEECIEAFEGSTDTSKSKDVVWRRYASSRPYVAQQSPAHEAANLLIRNRQALLKDANQWLHEEGYETIHREDLDMALRNIVVLLLRVEEEEDSDLDSNKKDEISTLLTYLDARMCVPRDMGNLPAKAIRNLQRLFTN